MKLDEQSEFLKKDPVLARIIEEKSPLKWEWRKTKDPFEALVQAIIFQQLATKAANTIYGRFKDKVEKIVPENVLSLSDEDFRSCGVSRQKTSYLRDLSEKFHEVVEGVEGLSDEEVIDSLIRVKGIGRWTAEMFLMFTLHREDIFPVDDLALRKAVIKAYGLDENVSKKELVSMAENWKPYRTMASLYFWASVD